MDELAPIYATAGLITAYFLAAVARGRFDPFEPVWLFLVGYTHLYIIQPISYHEWAVSARGSELVLEANTRILWALGLFLLVYHSGIGGLVARMLPRPPVGWSRALVGGVAPPLVIWGLICAGIVLRAGDDADSVSAEESLFRSFPFVMLVAAIMLIVTGRASSNPSLFLPAGIAAGAGYVLIWMFNGKRSHSLVGVLATVCAWYITRSRRPSWPVLFATAATGVLVVGVAIGWRNDRDHERSVAGFVGFVGDFNPKTVLESLNLGEDDASDGRPVTHESEEYGGYLLMMDTVPGKSSYDGGASYLRVFSTFIPRIVWPTKPVFGRAQWIQAWIAGSELERKEDFTGPAIGLLGATQLNGGAEATVIVIVCLSIFVRTAYLYFRANAQSPWVQFWWSISYYNAWFMVVNDDPLVWFYYNWGFTTMPLLVLMWWGGKWAGVGSAGIAGEAGRISRPIAAS